MTIAASPNATPAHLQAYQASSTRSAAASAPLAVRPDGTGATPAAAPAATVTPKGDSASFSAQGLALLDASGDAAGATG